MPEAAAELADFNAFAAARLTANDSVSLDELFDQWRETNPSVDDVEAIRDSLADMAAGERGKPFAEFAREFQKRHGLIDGP